MLHRLVVMWATPRSLSTAFVRVIDARGDFAILHEPLCDLMAGVPYEMREEPVRGRVDSSDELFARVTTLRARTPVFVKDTSEYDYTSVMSGSCYLREATHVFMLRDPAKVINSHYHINPNLRCEDVGFKHLAKLHDLVVAESRHDPVFVDADRLAVEPGEVLEKFCRDVGLEHIPASLQWRAGHLDLWQRTRAWHLDAADSTSIAPRPKQYEVRVDNDVRLRSYYEEQMPYYEHLKRASQAAHPETSLLSEA